MLHLQVNLKPRVPTKAVCAEHLELRKEILTLLNLQKQVVHMEDLVFFGVYFLIPRKSICLLHVSLTFVHLPVFVLGCTCGHWVLFSSSGYCVHLLAHLPPYVVYKHLCCAFLFSVTAKIVFGAGTGFHCWGSIHVHISCIWFWRNKYGKEMNYLSVCSYWFSLTLKTKFFVTSCNTRRQKVHLFVIATMKHQAHLRSVSSLIYNRLVGMWNCHCYLELASLTLLTVLSCLMHQDRMFIPDTMSFGGNPSSKIGRLYLAV